MFDGDEDLEILSGYRLPEIALDSNIMAAATETTVKYHLEWHSKAADKSTITGYEKATSGAAFWSPVGAAEA